jgi:hypothetical protein
MLKATFTDLNLLKELKGIRDIRTDLIINLVKCLDTCVNTNLIVIRSKLVPMPCTLSEDKGE